MLPIRTTPLLLTILPFDNTPSDPSMALTPPSAAVECLGSTSITNFDWQDNLISGAICNVSDWMVPYHSFILFSILVGINYGMLRGAHDPTGIESDFCFWCPHNRGIGPPSVVDVHPVYKLQTREERSEKGVWHAFHSILLLFLRDRFRKQHVKSGFHFCKNAGTRECRSHPIDETCK
jgi:hypothetical protein